MSGIKINTTQVEAVYRNLCTNARLEQTLDMLLSILSNRFVKLGKHTILDLTAYFSEMEELRRERKACNPVQDILRKYGIGKREQASVNALANSTLVYFPSVRQIQRSISTCNTAMSSMTEKARNLLSRIDALGNIPSDIADLNQRTNTLRLAIQQYIESAQTRIKNWKDIPQSTSCLSALERRLHALITSLEILAPTGGIDPETLKKSIITTAEKLRTAEIAFSAARSVFEDTLESLSLIEAITPVSNTKASSRPSVQKEPAPQSSEVQDEIAALYGEATQIVHEVPSQTDAYLSGLRSQVDTIFAQRREQPEYTLTTIRTYLGLMRDHAAKRESLRKASLEKLHLLIARLRELLDGAIRPSDQLEPQIVSLIGQLDTLSQTSDASFEGLGSLEQESERLCTQAQAEEEQLYLQLTLISRIDDHMANLGYEPDGEPEIHDDRPGMISRMRYRLSVHTYVVVHVSPSLKTTWYVEYAAPAGTKCTDDLSNDDREELFETMRQWEANYLRLGQSLAEEGIRVTIEKLDSQRVDEHTFVERQTGQQQRRRAVQTVRNHLQH